MIFFEIESIQQIVRAVSTARADDRAHIVASEHFFQFPRAPLGRAGEIKIVFEDGIEIERLVSQLAQSRAARFQQLGLDVAGRSDNADGVAGLKRRRLDARSCFAAKASVCHLNRERQAQL